MRANEIEKEVVFKAIRSGGPGGQHVNKTSSAAILYWDLESSEAVSDSEKSRLRQKLKNRMNKDGQIYIRSDQHRELDRNKSECLQKLLKVIREALKRQKKRKATKPTKASKEKRLKEKNQRSETKKSRQKPDW